MGERRADIRVHQWSTTAPDEEWFLTIWHDCQELGQSTPVRARDWDLLRIFMPPTQRQEGSAEVQYELSESYSIPCNLPITSAQECEKAAHAMGYSWHGVQRRADRLPDCLLSGDGGISFNENQEGTAD